MGAGLVGLAQGGESGRGVEGLVGRREYSHGPFEGSAALAQKLKGGYRDGWGWGRLSYGQREALEQIASKIARILTGDPNHLDHWDDLAGYALLGKLAAPNRYDADQPDV